MTWLPGSRQWRWSSKQVYGLTSNFPLDEKSGLVSQMRRAAASIPSNIAEGAARSGKREFANFISIARGSLSELHTQCLIAVDLGYLPQDHAAFASLERVSKLLTGLYFRLTGAAKKTSGVSR